MRHSRRRDLGRLVERVEEAMGREGVGGRAARRGAMEGAAAAAGAGVAGAGAFARLSSRPPEAPVTSRVVPTERRKTRVYFFDESRLERRVNGLDEVAAGVAAEIADSDAVLLLVILTER